MVMTEYEIEPLSIQSMTAALERAHEQISRDNVFGPERVQIQKAWDARSANNIESANQPPFNMVRTGINLYGCFDEEGRQTLPLKEVLTLKSRLREGFTWRWYTGKYS